MRKHILNRRLQLFRGSTSDLQPAMLHHSPHYLDAVERLLVGQEELELDVLLFKKCKRGPGSRRIMDGECVEDNHKQFADLAA